MTKFQPPIISDQLAFDDLSEVRHLRHHAPDRRRVFALDHLVEPRKSQALDHQLMLLRCGNGRAHVLQLDLRPGGSRFLLDLPANARHVYSSSAALPRAVATSFLSRSDSSALKVALITLCGLVVPMDLVSTFCTPAEVITAPPAPPAITPVPSGAGFSITRPAP